MKLNDIKLGQYFTGVIQLEQKNSAVLFISDRNTPVISQIPRSKLNFINIRNIFLPNTIQIIRSWSLQKSFSLLKHEEKWKYRRITNINSVQSSDSSIAWETTLLLNLWDLFYGQPYFKRNYFNLFNSLFTYYITRFPQDFKWICFLINPQNFSVNEKNIVVNRSLIRQSRLLYLYSLIYSKNLEKFENLKEEDELTIDDNLNLPISGILLGLYQPNKKVMWFCVYKNGQHVLNKVNSFIKRAHLDVEKIEEKQPEIIEKNLNVVRNFIQQKTNDLENKEKIISTFYKAVKIYSSHNLKDDPELHDTSLPTNLKAPSLIYKSLNYILSNEKIEPTKNDIKKISQKINKINLSSLRTIVSKAEKLSHEKIINKKIDYSILEKEQVEIDKYIEEIFIKKGTHLFYKIESFFINKVKNNDILNPEYNEYVVKIRNVNTNEKFSFSFYLPPLVENKYLFFNGEKYLLRNTLNLPPISFPKPFMARIDGIFSYFGVELRSVYKKDIFYIEIYNNSFPLIFALFSIYEPKEVLKKFDISVTKEKPINKSQFIQIGNYYFIYKYNWQLKLIEALSFIKNKDILNKTDISQYLVENVNPTIIKNISSVFENIFDFDIFSYLKTVGIYKKDIFELLKYVIQKIEFGDIIERNDLNYLIVDRFNLNKIILRTLIDYLNLNTLRSQLKFNPVSFTDKLFLFNLLREKGILILAEDSNPVKEVSDLTTLTYSFVSEFAGTDVRNFHPSFRGKIDPVDTPTNDNVGLVQRTTITSLLGNSNKLNTTDESYPFSYAVSSIPYARFNDGVRLQMAANHVRQAIPLRYSTVPYIQTGIEPILLKTSSFKKVSPVSGKITEILDFRITITSKTNEKIFIYLDPIISKNKNIITWKILKNIGDFVKENDLIAVAEEFHFRGPLTLGVNLYTCFLPTMYTFEDAIIISESTSKLLSSHSGEKYRIILYEDQRLDFINLKNLKQGDVVLSISGKVRTEEKMVDNEEDVINLSFIVESGKMKIITHSNSNIKSLKVYASKQAYNNDPVIKEICDKLSSYFPNTVGISTHPNDLIFKQQKVYAVIEFILEWYDNAVLGDKLTNRHGNKGVISLILPDDQMIRDENGQIFDIVFSSQGIIGRKNIGQLYELYLSKIVRELDISLKKNKNISEVKNYLNMLLNNQKDLVNASLEFFEKYGTLSLIIPPFNEPTYSTIKKVGTLLNIPMKSKVYSPIYNIKSLNDVATGYLYIYKLYHLSSLKVNARSIGSYTSLGEAVRGRRRGGGQKVDEQMKFVLDSYNVDNIKKEIFSIHSDDFNAKRQMFSKIIKTGSVSLRELPISFLGDKYIDILFLTLGVNV